MDDKKQNLGEEVKRRIFKKDATTQTRKETLTLTEMLFSGGFNGLFIGLLMSLAVSAVRNSVLGTIVVGGLVLMIAIAIGVYIYKRVPENKRKRRTYFIASGLLGLFLGLLMSLAVSAVKNSVLGAILVGGSVWMIGIGVYSASYHLKSEKEIEIGRKMFV